MQITFPSLILSTFFYLLATFLYLASFLAPDERSEKTAFLWVWLGFVGATVFLGLEAWTHGFAFPILNFAHVLAFFSWALAFLYLIPLARLKIQSFGLILAPVLFLLNIIAVKHISDPVYHANVQIYFSLHIIFAFFAYAALTLSFTAALLYLVQHRELKLRHPGTFYHKLPNLESLDQLTYQPMVFGVVLLICAVVVGMLWAHDSYGQVWLNDPKTFLTFAAIGLYCLLISLRFKTPMRTSRLAVMTLIIFGFVIASFVGGRFLQDRHGSAAFNNGKSNSLSPVNPSSKAALSLT